MKYLQQVKSALFTALIVLVVAQMVMAMVVPYMPLIIGGLLLTAIALFAYNKFTRL